MSKHCIVADLRFVIDTDDEALLGLLAPRYAPFSRKAEVASQWPLLFAIHHTERFDPLPEASLMSEFECEGATCIYEQTDERVSISLLHPQSREVQSQMQCGRDFKDARCWLSGNAYQREYQINNYLMMMFAFASMDRQTLLFHASVIAREGKAYLFLAKSGTGKSTHSTLWLKHVPGCQLVNDDNPAVGIRDGRAVVYGTPWSGKTPCYRNVSFPVGGFVQITRDQTNHISRQAPVQALATLLPSCSGVKWDKHLYRSQCEALSQLIAIAPVHLLGCTPYREAAVVCSKGVGAWDGIAEGEGFAVNEESMKPAGVSLPSEP